MQTQLLSLAVYLALAAPALADTHQVTVVNGTGQSMTSIRFAPAGSPMPSGNRLRSSLPPNAQAQITYSTGCPIDIWVAYADGGSDARKGVDACSDPRVDFGSSVTTTDAAVIAAQSPAVPLPAVQSQAAKPAAPAPGSAASAAAGPAAPAWDGKALTKKLGLDGWVDP